MNFATLAKFAPLMTKFGGLKGEQITPTVITELAAVFGMSPDPAAVTDVVSLLRQDDSEALISWVSEPTRLAKVISKLTRQKPVADEVIKCPHCGLFSMNVEGTADHTGVN